MCGYPSNDSRPVPTERDGGKENDCKFTYIHSSNELQFNGNGEMRQYTEKDLPTWHQKHVSIQTITISGITSIGNYAFYESTGITGLIT